ncbi:MAG: tetratricopeptide repeat protein [Planctomycetota bacterium]|nr:tetratricopeptide repeat protein [Planctomycetota bacterium]
MRTQPVGKKALAVLLTSIPGLGHVLLDRHPIGVFLFTVFAVSANGALIGARLWVNREHQFFILLLSTLGLLFVYPHAFISIWRLTFGVNDEVRAEARADRLKQAVSHYLRGQLDDAAGILRKLLRQDELDVDCLFYLAMIHRDRGDRTKATRAFRRCAALNGKWKWEAQQEIQALRSK